MTLLIEWSGDGLSGALTIASADADDTAPTFITGAVPTIEPVPNRSPAIRFAQSGVEANYARWDFSAADLAAYALRFDDVVFTAFVAATQQSFLQVVNAGETLLSWGVALNSLGQLQIINAGGGTASTGTVALTPGTSYRIEAVVNGTTYDVYAYLTDTATLVDHVEATLAPLVQGGRVRLGNNFTSANAPAFYVAGFSVYDTAELPALDLTDVSHCWASITDVLDHAKTVATAEDVVMAQGIIEGAANRVWRETDSTESDYYWLKRAVAWQSKYVVDNPDLFAMAGDLTSLSQDGFSASWGGSAVGAGSMVGRLVSPVAMMMLNNLRQGANTTLRVNSGFQGARRRGRGGVRWTRA